MSELFLSMAMPETPIWGNSSERGVQFKPESVERQIPPAGAPT